MEQSVYLTMAKEQDKERRHEAAVIGLTSQSSHLLKLLPPSSGTING